LQTWEGRKMEGKVSVRHLHSDASNFGWGALDVK
jgi:hypothetical protein